MPVHPDVVPRRVVARVDGSPQLAHLDRFLELAGRRGVVPGLDVEALALAHAIAKVPGFRGERPRLIQVAQIVVGGPHLRPGGREPGIDRRRALEVTDGLLVLRCLEQLHIRS